MKPQLCEFCCLVGKSLKRVQNISDERIEFETRDGEVFALYHEQDCCECVMVEDICGDLDDLVGSPILLAEETINEGSDVPYGTHTWTFYKLRTIKGSVDIRWYGESNGYYSESVDFAKIA